MNIKDNSVTSPEPSDLTASLTTSSSPKKDVLLESSTNVMTLKPYDPMLKKRRKQVFKPHPTLDHFDTIFGIDNWARFLTLKSNNKLASSMLENRLLHECPTKELGFRLKEPNEWLIEATTKNQSEAILNIEEIAGIKVEVTRHDTLNYIQGTVILPHIQDETIPEKKILLESLQLRYNNVHDIEVFEIKSRKDPQIKLNIMKIKFMGQEIPQKIKILGQNREVRPYIPKPLQCDRCCKYGHTHKRCTSKEVCTMCGSQQHKTNWNCEHKKCLNCGEEHHAKDKKCVFYIYNTELKLLMSRTGMSAREAKLELKVRGVNDPARNPSYRTAVIKSFSNTEKPRKTHSENDNIEAVLNEIFGNVETGNRFNVLEEEEVSKDLIELEDTNTGEKKRTLDSTPPKSKRAINKNNYQSDLSDGNIETGNRFDILEEEEVSKDLIEIENTNEGERKKRPLDRTPPKPKKVNNDISCQSDSSEKSKQANNKKEVKKMEVSENPEKLDEEDISPSPIIGGHVPKQVPSLERTKDLGEISSSPIFGKPYPRQVPPFEQMRDHDDSCGCHECFINICRQRKNTTKESWMQMICNFAKERKIESSKLELHKKGCMCVSHLLCISGPVQVYFSQITFILIILLEWYFHAEFLTPCPNFW